MGLIERAAKRLEELRRAGVEPPALGDGTLPDAPAPVTPSRPPATAAAAPSATAPSSAPLAPAPSPAARGPAPARRAPLVLDLARLAQNGFVTPDLPTSRIANEFRIIKQPLIANAVLQGPTRIRNGNLIMVTSAVPGEGKTFSAINLAMSMAMELDRTVLLIDADVARPSLPGVLGMRESGPGLLDILAPHAARMADVLYHTNVPKLTFLSTGRQHPHAAEVLASESMTRLLSELAERYSDRIVIFDSPPLLVTTEARILATRMGQIVFVVGAESTPQRDVQRALATIEACPVKLAILNKAQTTGQGAYGYNYGYGYNSESGRKDAK